MQNAPNYNAFFNELTAIRPITPAFINGMESLIETWPVLENDILIRQGQRVTHYFSQREGFAMGYVINSNNEKEVRRFWTPSDRIMAGDDPLGESQAEENIVALTPGTVYALSLANINALCAEFEEARYFLGHFQGKEISLLKRRIHELTTFDSQTRYDHFRLRYPPQLEKCLRRKDLLASYLNMTRQTLSTLDMPPLEELRRRHPDFR